MVIYLRIPPKMGGHFCKTQMKRLLLMLFIHSFDSITQLLNGFHCICDFLALSLFMAITDLQMMYLSIPDGYFPTIWRISAVSKPAFAQKPGVSSDG